MSDRPKITKVRLSEDGTRAALEYADQPGKLFRVMSVEVDSPERHPGKPVEWSAPLVPEFPVSAGWPASTPIYEEITKGKQ